MVKVELITQVVDLTKLADPWNQLALPSPMQSPEWMLAWWDAFQTDHDSLHVLAIRDAENQLVGLVPWYRREGFASGATLRFLGDGRACSDFQSVLCRAGYESEIVEALIRWLTSDPAARWDLLDLEGVSAKDPVMSEFQSLMQARGHVTHRRQTLNTWRISLEGGLSGVTSRFSKTQASQVRNFINRFDKGDFALRHASKELDQSEFFIAELMRLHQLNWQSLGQPGCFASAEFRSFFQNAIQTMLGRGMAEIILLERESRIVAAHVSLLQGSIGFGYQCGRDPAENANRVGRIIQAVALRDNCEAGLKAFDFLRGDEEYKQQWRAEPTPCERLRVVARTRMSELRHSIWATCREVKAAVGLSRQG